MELKELRNKPAAELQRLLKLYREQSRDLRFKISAKQHKDVRELRDTKKLIARILTVLKEKEVIRSFAAKNTTTKKDSTYGK